MDTTRREYLLDQALKEGRIAVSTRAAWSARWDADPATTEATLARLAPVPVGAGVLGHADPVEQTLAAGRAMLQRSVPRLAIAATAPAPAAPAADPQIARTLMDDPAIGLSPEQVEEWTRNLFPETRAGAGARKGRVTVDEKYARGAA